jgi:hypothetical protein
MSRMFNTVALALAAAAVAAPIAQSATDPSGNTVADPLVSYLQGGLSPGEIRCVGQADLSPSATFATSVPAQAAATAAPAAKGSRPARRQLPPESGLLARQIKVLAARVTRSPPATGNQGSARPRSRRRSPADIARRGLAHTDLLAISYLRDPA